MPDLEKELATYKKHLPELLGHEGKFVLIHGEHVIDIYSSYEDALKAGYEKTGVHSFLVKKISGVESVGCFSRELNGMNSAPLDSSYLPPRPIN